MIVKEIKAKKISNDDYTYLVEAEGENILVTITYNGPTHRGNIEEQKFILPKKVAKVIGLTMVEWSSPEYKFEGLDGNQEPIFIPSFRILPVKDEDSSFS